MRYSRAGAVWCAIYLSAVFCLPSAAADEMVQESRCVKGSILLNHRLEKEYVEDDFHIFYSLQGRDALRYQYDSSGSGVPDSIKDIAGQLQAAKYLYSSVLGLRFPLQQKIYAQARQINVYVLQLPKGNGLAFDRVAAETMNDGRQLPCGLKFVLNAALEPARNITPAHEFFHLYQYGYAVFKQKWYLEGMARWMENSFKAPEKNTRRLSPLPHCDSNFTRGYNAANYWASFAQAHFADVAIPAAAQRFRYSDGSPVLIAQEVKGGAMLAPFFNQLAQGSAAQSRQLNQANIRWSEALQRSPQFNEAICQALAAAVAEKK